MRLICPLLVIALLVLLPSAALADYDYVWQGWGGPAGTTGSWMGNWASPGNTYSNGWGETWMYYEDPAPYYPSTSDDVQIPAGVSLSAGGNGRCANLDIEEGASLLLPCESIEIAGPTLRNDGAIHMSAYTASLGLVRLVGDLELTGEGEIHMDGGRFADVGATRTLTVGPGQTISGWGEFGADSYWGRVNLHNLGHISASGAAAGVSLRFYAVEAENDSMMEAVSRELQLSGIWDNHDGVIRAGDGQVVWFVESSAYPTEIIGGLLETVGSGEIRAASEPLLDGCTVAGRLHVPTHYGMALRQGLTIDGELDMGMEGGSGNANVKLTSDVALDGAGVVRVGETNMFMGIEWPAENFDLTIGPDLTVELVGGHIGRYPDYYGDRRLELYNQGTIVCRGQITNTRFDVAGAGFVNTGLLDVAAAAPYASVYGDYLQTAGETRVNGQLRFAEGAAEFTGGVLSGAGGVVGAVRLSGDAAVEPGGSGTAGTFSVSGSLTLDDGCAYDWDYAAAARDLLAVYGDLTLAGDLSLRVADPEGAGLAAGDYVLIDVSGEIADDAVWSVTLPDGWLSAGVETIGSQVILRDLRLDPVSVDGDAPAALALFGAFPNPFNPDAEIRFALERERAVSLRIFDATGRLTRTLIADETLSAGPHAARWDGRNDAGAPVASGAYLSRLTSGGIALTAKLTLIK